MGGKKVGKERKKKRGEGKKKRKGRKEEKKKRKPRFCLFPGIVFRILPVWNFSVHLLESP